jgi:molybdenum cofactor guanylyltransferase
VPNQPQKAQPVCCAVILAGGRNTRMDGRNKAFLEVGGKTILERLTETLRLFFTEILLVTRSPELYAQQPVRIVQDIYPARASLTGVHAGLAHAVADYAFVVPCDTPFLKPELIRMLLDEIEPEVDVIVPMVDGYFEPLCAIYSKRCLGPIEAQLDRGDYKISRIFDQVRLKAIPVEKLKAADARLDSFFNVNTPAALKASRDFEKQSDDPD